MGKKTPKYVEEELGKELPKPPFRFTQVRNESYQGLIDSGYRYIPNPSNGGDDDYIIVDLERKEFTHGESGYPPFYDIEELNWKYRDKDLKELQGRNYRI